MNLILTSAWNPTIPQTTEQLAARRERLLASLDHYASCGVFRQIVLLDGTLTEQDVPRLTARAPALVRVARPRVEAAGPFRGPSYLEALLYTAAAPQLLECLASEQPCFKVSGGYIVRNIQALASLVQERRLSLLGFLHQNPLRLHPRYAMTSCMAMDGSHWRRFINFLGGEIERLRQAPLEGLYTEFLLANGAKRGASLPYPRLDAYFHTGGMHSSALPYRLREAAWRVQARVGLFVLSKASAAG